MNININKNGKDEIPDDDENDELTLEQQFRNRQNRQHQYEIISGMRPEVIGSHSSSSMSQDEEDLYNQSSSSSSNQNDELIDLESIDTEKQRALFSDFESKRELKFSPSSSSSSSSSYASSSSSNEVKNESKIKSEIKHETHPSFTPLSTPLTSLSDVKNVKNENKSHIIKTDKTVIEIDDEVEELDRSATELDIMEQESAYQDRPIKEDVVEENHHEDMHSFLGLRELLMPFDHPAHAKFYSKRHSLLNEDGRIREWIRTGFKTKFTTALFSTHVNRWYRENMYRSGFPVSRNDGHIRRVDVNSIVIPVMTFDKKDKRLKTRLITHNDLKPHSFTLRAIHETLSYEPPPQESYVLTEATLEREMNRVIYHKRTVAKIKSMPVSPPAPAIDMDEIDPDEEKCRCQVCGRWIFGPFSITRKCLVCTQFAEQVKIERNNERMQKNALRNEKEGIPSLQQVPVTAPVASTVHFSSSNQSINDVSRRVESLSPMPQSIPTNVSVPFVSSHTMPNDANFIQSVPSYLSSSTFSTPPVASIQNSDQDAIEESASVLGDILRIFPQSQRNMFRYTRSSLPRLTARDRIAAVSEMRTLYNTFNGSHETAPQYLTNLCEQIMKYSFSIGEVVQMCKSVFVGDAAAWFSQAWAICSSLPESEKPIQVLFHQFLDRYMDTAVKFNYKQQLNNTKMNKNNATIDDVRRHYSKFLSVLNNLRMCEQNLNMSDMVQTYYRSLPERCIQYIGSSYNHESTLESIQRLAEQAILFSPSSQRTVNSDNDGTQSIRMNAIPTTTVNDNNNRNSPGNSKNRNRSSPKRFDPTNERKRIDEKDVLCFHCGKKGHYAGIKCPIISQQQTRQGAAAFAEANKRRAVPYSYSREKAIELSTRIEKMKAEEAQNRTSSSPSSSSSSSSSSSRGRSFHPRGRGGSRASSGRSNQLDLTRNDDDENDESDD